MADEIEDANILSEGLLITLKDGREALLKTADLVDCAEKSNAFVLAESMQAEKEDSEEPPAGTQ